jgi:hypothetical protein
MTSHLVHLHSVRCETEFVRCPEKGVNFKRPRNLVYLAEGLVLLDVALSRRHRSQLVHPREERGDCHEERLVVSGLPANVRLRFCEL